MDLIEVSAYKDVKQKQSTYLKKVVSRVHLKHYITKRVCTLCPVLLG
jgi:hypothetical protein